MKSSAAIEQAFTGTTCRDRLRQVLTVIDERGGVGADVMPRLVEDSVCPAGHDLHYASLTSGLIAQSSPGALRLSRSGDDWLLNNGRPSPDWKRSIAEGAAPLRDWQDEALQAWCAHGRHGVIEAVTGTGKSRVGVEATREALADDYSVVIVVPTVDLVAQWVQTLRQNKVPGVGALGDGQKASFRTHRVIVGTVQSLYPAPPTRPDGKVLVVADECHRYGAGQWRRVLDPSYKRRLGLTATFERNDDGIKELLPYFGGGPVFTIGFRRAIDDGVVTHYDVKLLGVPLAYKERAEYDEADKTLRDARVQLLVAGFPAEPFGAFLHEVVKAAEDDDDPTITDVARRYLKAFSKRIDIMTNAAAKLDVTRSLAPRVERSGGTIVFTRRVDMAEEIAATLIDSGVRAQPIHSDLTRTQRHERLSALKNGRIKALVAPTILDEGIDVPDIDLAVVMGGSRSRRQMIQRMGRVLRLKPDGRKATFIVVYAENTAEDLTQTDGAEGCLDLIVQSADTIERLALEGGEIAATDVVVHRVQTAPTAQAGQPAALVVEELTASTPATTTAISGLDPDTCAVAARAVREYRRYHECTDEEAVPELRQVLRDFTEECETRPGKQPGLTLATALGFQLVLARHGIVGYHPRGRGELTWREARDLPPVFEQVAPALDLQERHPFEQIPATSLMLTVSAFAAVVSAYRLHEDYVAGRRSFLRDLAELNVERPAVRVRKDGSLLIAGTTLAVQVSQDGRRLLDVRRRQRSFEIDENESEQRRDSGQSPPPSAAADSEGRRPPAGRRPKGTGSHPRRQSSPADLLQENPAALRDLLDADNISVDMPAVIRAAEAFDYGDPFTEVALERTRSLLRRDLQSSPDIEFTSDVFVLHGPVATWTLRGDGQVVLDMEPRAAHGPGVQPMSPLTASPDSLEGGDAPREQERVVLGDPEVDIVTQIERLAALRGRGLLTEEEFSAAKARILF